MENIVLVDGIDADVAGTAGPERAVAPPAVAIGKVEGHGIAQSVTRLHRHTLHVDAAIPEIGVHQIRIERILLGVVPEDIDLPVVFRFQLSDADTDHIGVALVALVRMQRRGRASRRLPY